MNRRTLFKSLAALIAALIVPVLPRAIEQPREGSLTSEQVRDLEIDEIARIFQVPRELIGC